jgi:hypothetical protein
MVELEEGDLQKRKKKYIRFLKRYQKDDFDLDLCYITSIEKFIEGLSNYKMNIYYF